MEMGGWKVMSGKGKIGIIKIWVTVSTIALEIG
jgi:hypothetical protein